MGSQSKIPWIISPFIEVPDFPWIFHLLSNSLIFPELFQLFQILWFFQTWNFTLSFPWFPWFSLSVGTLYQDKCSRGGV